MRKSLLSLAFLCIALQLFAIEEKKNPNDSIRVYEIPEVIVYSTRMATPLKKVPMKIELIQSADIQKSGYTELTDLLKNYSSVDVIQYPGFLSSVGIRGFSPNGKYVSVLVDGIPSGTTNISTIGLSSVNQVEILKGPFSAAYGTNAMGGVVNIISEKSKGDLKGRVMLGAGSYSQYSSSVSLGGSLSEKTSFDANLSYVTQRENYETGGHNLLSLTDLEKLIIDQSTNSIQMPESKYSTLSGRLRLGYDFSSQWSLNFYNSFFDGNGIPNGGSIWGVYGKGKKDLNRYSGSLELLGETDIHQIRLTPYYTIERSNFYSEIGDAGFINSASKNKTYGLMAQDRIKFDTHQLVYGIDAKIFKRDSKSYEKENQGKAPYQPAYGTSNMAVFLQSNFNFLEERINISAGGRLDYLIFNLSADPFLKNEKKHEKHLTVSPNIGLKYSPVKGLAIHSSYGMGFLAPDAYQKSGEYNGTWGITRGNRDLKPERSSTIDVGVGYDNHQAGLYADVTYFNTAHKDFIISTPLQEGDKKITTFKNANKAKISGVEAILSYDLGSIWDYRFSLRTFMNATFIIDSKLKQTDNDSKWDDMRYVRKQNITFGMEYQGRNGLELAINGRFSGHRLEDNWYGWYPNVRPELSEVLKKEKPEYAEQNILQHPETLIFNASVYYNFTEQLRAGINALNIFDENYAEKDGYNMPGRSFMFNISYSF